ncbi:MAG: diguanylate cyclase, partial [Pseudomonadota bacterium]
HAFTDDERRRLAKPARILVIDENDTAARQLVDPLRIAGHHVTAAQGAEPAGEGAKGPDVILLALSDQSYDPLRLCAHLRSMETGSEYAIIVTHDQDDQDRAIEALNIGASDTISMPVDHQELLARVRTQLKRSRYIEILRERVDRGLELSMIDQLTELYNRRYMLNQLEQWMARSAISGPPVSVIAFDIDHFKPINDEYGHETGDLILSEFARRIVQHIRPKDVACRMGGEEFLVILPETNADKALAGAERIRQAIANAPFEIERTGQSISVTVSAGIASDRGAGDTVADLLHRADSALYRAKQGGRNRIEGLAA